MFLGGPPMLGGGMPMQVVMMDDDGPQDGPGLDPFAAEILKRMGLQLPGGPVNHGACQGDSKKFCDNKKDQAGQHSFMLCLSAHAQELEPKCYDMIKGSLPHVCRPEIESMCDPMKEGILDCMERNMGKLSGKCLDAYGLVRKHIDQIANAKDVSLVHKPSGDARPFLHDFKALSNLEKKAINDVVQMKNDFFDGVARETHSLGPTMGFFALAFACMYCVSQDGNRIIIADLMHRCTRYQFESKPKARGGQAGADLYGSTLTI